MFETDDSIPWRVTQLEEDVKSMSSESRRLSDAILLLGVKLENAVSEVTSRFQRFEESRSFWNRVLVGIVTAGIIAIVTLLLKVSFGASSNAQ